MYDAGFPSEISGLQRASGELRVTLKERDGASVLDGREMLAAIDLSGSMREPAGDSTRVELMQKSTQDALAILPDGSQIGAWGFSTARGPGGEDFFEMVPIRGLQTNVDGKTQRQLLSEQVAGQQNLIGGDTGLYDTALAA